MDKTAPETCEQCPTRGTHRCLVRDLDATTGKYVRRPGPRCPFVRLDAARVEVDRLDQAVASALVLAQEKEADLARITRNHDHLAKVVNGQADKIKARNAEIERLRAVQNITPCVWTRNGSRDDFAMNPHFNPAPPAEGEVHCESVSVIRRWQTCPYCSRPVEIARQALGGPDV